jgi:hypothetical protein
VILRDITDLAGCRAAVALQEQVWGQGSEIVPASVLLVSAKRGGILIGAFDEAGLAGFVWSMPGVRDGVRTHWSHMLGVHPDARIVQHEYIQSAKQKNWAIPQCTYEWVLQVDSDEVLEEGLAEELRSALTRVAPQVNGFRIPFKHYILGEWVRVCNLYPEYHVRLFRREQGRFQERQGAGPNDVASIWMSFMNAATSLVVMFIHRPFIVRISGSTLALQSVHWMSNISSRP